MGPSCGFPFRVCIYCTHIDTHIVVESLSHDSLPQVCDSTDCSPPGSSVHGVLQARTLVWVAMSFSRGSSQFRDQTGLSCVSYTDRQILYH